MKREVIQAPDLKAPRYRPKATNLIDKEHFEKFKEQYPKYKDLTIQEYRKIIEDFNNCFWENVIETRDGCRLPESLGYVFIGACDPPVTQNINYNKSIKYGKALLNNNWLTDGKLAKIFLSTNAEKYKFKHREYWGFIACRNFKRAVARTFPENWNKYHRIEKTKKLNALYRKSVVKELLEKKYFNTNPTNNFDI